MFNPTHRGGLRDATKGSGTRFQSLDPENATGLLCGVYFLPFSAPQFFHLQSDDNDSILTECFISHQKYELWK